MQLYTKVYGDVSKRELNFVIFNLFFHEYVIAIKSDKAILLIPIIISIFGINIKNVWPVILI